MGLPTPKQLIALAKACRKVGITHFEGEGIKFDLDVNSHSLPKKALKNSYSLPVAQEDVETDGWESLSEEAKIAWSTGAGEEPQ